MVRTILATSVLAPLIPLAFGLSVIQKTTWHTALVSPDITYSGTYTIRNCHTDTGKVDAALKLLHTTLGPAIQDAEQDAPSAAYKTFFKDIAEAPYIRSVLSNITTGAAMSLNAEQLQSTGDIEIVTGTFSPEIVCISKPGELLYHPANRTEEITDHYEVCQKDPRASASILITRTPYIVLCPSFFALDLAPAEATCPRVNKWLNRYSVRDGGKSLIFYQIYNLLHPLAQLYISATSHGHVRVAGLNACVRVKAEHASKNAESYEFFVANILSNCTLFPRVYDDNGRELLYEHSPAENATEHHRPPVWVSDIDMIDHP